MPHDWFMYHLRSTYMTYKNRLDFPFKACPIDCIRNEDNVSCSGALLPMPVDSNRGPNDWESVVVSTKPQKLLENVPYAVKIIDLYIVLIHGHMPNAVRYVQIQIYFRILKSTEQSEHKTREFIKDKNY